MERCGATRAAHRGASLRLRALECGSRRRSVRRRARPGRFPREPLLTGAMERRPVDSRPPAAYALAAVGALWVAWGLITFRRAGTAVFPDRPASRIVIAGHYRFGRNPVSRGLSGIYWGFTLWMGSAPTAASLAAAPGNPPPRSSPGTRDTAPRPGASRDTHGVALRGVLRPVRRACAG